MTKLGPNVKLCMQTIYCLYVFTHYGVRVQTHVNIMLFLCRHYIVRMQTLCCSYADILFFVCRHYVVCMLTLCCLYVDAIPLFASILRESWRNTDMRSHLVLMHPLDISCPSRDLYRGGHITKSTFAPLPLVISYLALSTATSCILLSSNPICIGGVCRVRNQHISTDRSMYGIHSVSSSNVYVSPFADSKLVTND